jgi:hypothetical protein
MSIVSRHADLAFALAQSGVVITLGGASTTGLVRAADEEVLAASGSPVSLIGKATLVIIARGSLSGLASDAQIVVTEGPLAGTYQVDRVLTSADGEVTRFIAFPTAASTAPAVWSRGAILLPWGTRRAGALAGPAFDRQTIAGAAVLVLEVDAGATGADPLLEVEIHDSVTEAGTYSPTGLSFDPVTEQGDTQALTLTESVRRWFKLAPTITGDEDPVFDCGAVVLDVAAPR